LIRHALGKLAAAFAAALCACAASFGATPGPLRLALVENEPAVMTLQLVQPVERALREAGQDAALESVDETLCSFSGGRYELQLPVGEALPALPAAGAALESAAETVFISPPSPSLLSAISKNAADPATFRSPDSMALAFSTAEVSGSISAQGAARLVYNTGLSHPASAAAHTALSAYYRFRWHGKEVRLAVVGRAYGGFGRLEEALRRERLEGPLIGLARGGTFDTGDAAADGRAAAEALERAGLEYSAVSASEIRNWTQLQTYREERPEGIQYLSANLVYSSAPEHTVFPAYAVFTASATRVAVVGLTPEWTGRLLKAAGVAGIQVKDPVAALNAMVPALRAAADTVIVLSPLGPAKNSALASMTRGIDLILADDAPFLNFTPPPSSVIEQDSRPPFANPFPPLRVYGPALNIVEIAAAVPGGHWEIRQRAVFLDDSLPQNTAAQAAAVEPEPGQAVRDAVLIPAARDVFPQNVRAGLPVYGTLDFWTLAAGMLSARAGAEAGLLPSSYLTNSTVGAVRESLARRWLGPPDRAVLVAVPGSKLKSLADETEDQKRNEAGGLDTGGGMQLAVSGFDSKKGLVGGTPFNPSETYFLATSRRAAEELGLPGPYTPLPDSATVTSAVLDGLRAAAGRASPADWRGWMTGLPVGEHGTWRINFREADLNLQNTRVRRSSDFDQVSNARIQGMDEALFGWDLKADAEYLQSRYKWTNTLEMDYAKDRLSPRGEPSVTSLSANRVMFLTLGTLRAGDVPYAWLARSWGPSLGFEADGEFQASPGLPKKRVYSVFPGVEFYDGSTIKTLELTADIKRDLSHDPPDTQYGLRLRTLISAPLGPGGAKLDGELWNNYFFLSHSDAATDLRMEGDANMKLVIPAYKHLSVSPFADFYWFELKTKPVWGYSLMTGISIGFSRLWKPQFKSLTR
jgi:hypothetical protein